MISDDEKAHIAERVEYENQLRRALDKDEKPEPKSRWGWLDSKLGLMVIGALLTGLLVPAFQFTQETIKWTRQNRYSNLHYRVEAVRGAMGELTRVQIFVSEAYERTRRFIEAEKLDAKQIQSYHQQMVEMNNRRFARNAEFVARLSSFDDRERSAVREAFEQYLSATEALLRLLDSAVESKARAAGRTTQGNADATFHEKAQVLMDEINSDYEKALDIIRDYLRRLEDESTQYT